MGHVNRLKLSHVLFVKAQKPPTGGQIVVYHVKHLAVDALPEARQDNGLRTIIHISEWYRVGSAQMQKDAEGANSYSSCDRFVAGTVHIARSDDDVGDAQLATIFGDNFVLLHLGEAVGFPPSLGVNFHGTRLVQKPSARLPPVRVNREGADIDKPLQGTVLRARLKKISGGDDRVHESIGKGLFPSPRSEVKDYRCTFCRNSAILPPEKVACDDFDASPLATGINECLDSLQVGGTPNEAPHLVESMIEQMPHHSTPYETGSACDQDRVISPYDPSVAVSHSHVPFLFSDVSLPYGANARHGKQLAHMVTKLDQEIHEPVMP